MLTLSYSSYFLDQRTISRLHIGIYIVYKEGAARQKTELSESGRVFWKQVFTQARLLPCLHLSQHSVDWVCEEWNKISSCLNKSHFASTIITHHNDHDDTHPIFSSHPNSRVMWGHCWWTTPGAHHNIYSNIQKYFNQSHRSKLCVTHVCKLFNW